MSTTLVRSLCRLRADAKRRGQHHLTHERRLARFVLQGMVSQAKAEDALCVLLMGIYCHDQASGEIDAGWWLDRARKRLNRAMAEESVARGETVQAIKAQLQSDINAREKSDVMIARARDINHQRGLSLAWPEILDIITRELRAAVQPRLRRYG